MRENSRHLLVTVSSPVVPQREDLEVAGEVAVAAE